MALDVSPPRNRFEPSLRPSLALPRKLKRAREFSISASDVDLLRFSKHIVVGRKDILLSPGGPSGAAAKRLKRKQAPAKLLCRALPCPLRPRPLLRRILDRTQSSAANHQSMRRRAEVQFGNFKLGKTLDTHAPHLLPGDFPHGLLHMRTEIIEIISARNFIFGLAKSGVCRVFDRVSGKPKCFMNISDDEVVRSLFYNKKCGALITVSVYHEDGIGSLKCRSTPLKSIAKNKPGSFRRLFQEEKLNYPGFVEFDDVNGKILTYSETNHRYRVWNLADYSMLYELSDENVEEVKISPGIMLIIHEHKRFETEGPNKAKLPPDNRVKLRIINIENGEELKQWYQPLETHELREELKGQRRTRSAATLPIMFIEQFNEKLLIKQHGHALRLVDVRTGAVQTVPDYAFPAPSAFVFLYELRLFLTFSEADICVWNFRGEKVATFENREVLKAHCNTNSIYISKSQDLMISYVPPSPFKDNNGMYTFPDNAAGKIKVTRVLDGKCLARISHPKARDATPYVQAGDPLGRVAALHFNEEHNEIYTGTPDGRICVWTN
jgi:hypothetical protein